jgi:hypothetical protein
VRVTTWLLALLEKKLAMAAENVPSIHLRGKYRLTASARVFTRIKEIYLAQHLICVKALDSLINQSALMSDVVLQTSTKINDFLCENIVNSM